MVEGEEYTYAFISDLHCGSVYFDYPSFRRVIEKLKDEKLKARHLYLLGDLIEGKLNHKGQLYEAFPIEYQLAILRSIVERLVVTLGAKHLYILPGNHDRKYGLNLLDTFILKNQPDFEKMGIEVKYLRDKDFHVNGQVLVVHGLSVSGGSDYTSVTPLVLNNLVGLVRLYGYFNIRYIVTGHYHRYGDIYYQGFRVIVLPSFQYSSRPLRECRGIVLLNGDGRTLPVLVQPSKREEILEYWEERIRRTIAPE